MLRHYRTIKADPNPSPYLLAPLGPGQRWVVGSLRAGCLPLVVETGRYRSPKVPLVDRVCTLCDTGCVEDEIHFITTCRALHNHRLSAQWLGKYSTVDWQIQHCGGKHSRIYSTVRSQSGQYGAYIPSDGQTIMINPLKEASDVQLLN